MYKTKRELARSRSTAAKGWNLALLPSPWKRVMGPLGEHADPQSLIATPTPLPDQNLRYVPWGFPLTERWGLALKSRKCWKMREGLQVVKFSLTQKNIQVKETHSWKTKGKRQKISITFNFDFLDQRSQSFCFIICFVSS